MADILIRGVPDEVVAVVEANATRVGLSRAEYIRRILEREQRKGGGVNVDSLQRFSHTFRDLDDDEVMRSAWS